MIGFKRFLDKQQEQYEEYGRGTGEWGDENLFRTAFTKVPEDVVAPKEKECEAPRK